VLAAALAFELRPFSRRLAAAPPRNGLAHGEHGGRAVSLLAAGMGRRGDEAFARALRELQPAQVINIGIAGALDREHSAGSTWIVDEWHDPQPPYGLAARADAALCARIGATLDGAGVGWGNARAVMVDEPLHDADERDRIRDGSGAHLVEMEGAAWAGIAAELGIPFAAVRVVSDHADRPLPGPRPKDGRRARLLRDDGTARVGRIVWALLASRAWLRPWHHVTEIKAAGVQFRVAMHGLDAVAEALLPGPEQAVVKV